jgi:hypothetical protein
MKKLPLLYIVILLSLPLHAQVIKNPSYTIETGIIASGGDQTPFWLLSNQYGLITPHKFNSWLQVGFHSPLDSSKKLDYDYGFDLVNRYSNQHDIYFHQAYVRLKWKFLRLQAGSMEEIIGNQDPELSSGGLLWSGNARPMPKITMLVPEYTKVPFFKGYLEFKAGLSHGWFDNNEYVKNAWLHHKYIYVRIGGKLPVNIHYGFHHYAQWGGVTSDPSIGKLPSGFSDYIKVFLGKSGEGSTSTPWSEAANKIGNHIGSENIGFDIKLKKYLITGYWQTIFEDNSGMHHRNIEDGLRGISIHSINKIKLVNAILYEYIQTTDQSGPSHDPTPDFQRGGGNDNYFNHGVYIKGWTSHEMTIGTPFITSPIIQHGQLQFLTAGYLINNKVKGHHVGLSGQYKKLSYKWMYSYTKNYGTNDHPAYWEQNSLVLKTCIRQIIPWGLDAGISVGIDNGGLYGNNAGVMVSLIKTGRF